MGRATETTREQFLRTIFNRASGGLIELRAIPVDKSGKVVRTWTKSLKQIEEFSDKYGKKGSNYGVYFGVCKRKGEGGRKEDVLGATCLWADIDCDVNGQDPKRVLSLIGEMPANIQPSIVVHSGGGFHLYWLLDEECTRQGVVEAANQEMMQLVGGDNVHDVTRVMRMPGTSNNKRGGKRCHVVYCAPHMLYNVSQLLYDVGKWGKLLDGEDWAPRKAVEKREFALKKEDILHRFQHAVRGRSGGALHKMWEAQVREHAPRGYIGIHEAIVISTARLHCSGDFSEQDIVNRVLGWIKGVPGIDARRWDWTAEEKKVRDALRTWGPKWKDKLKAERLAKKKNGGVS